MPGTDLGNLRMDARLQQALNSDPRYQLTVIGSPATAYISEKVSGNRFAIKTSEPGVEVSWQVTGIRKDDFALAHPVIVEEEKAVADREAATSIPWSSACPHPWGWIDQHRPRQRRHVSCQSPALGVGGIYLEAPGGRGNHARSPRIACERISTKGSVLPHRRHLARCLTSPSVNWQPWRRVSSSTSIAANLRHLRHSSPAETFRAATSARL